MQFYLTYWIKPLKAYPICLHLSLFWVSEFLVSVYIGSVWFLLCLHFLLKHIDLRLNGGIMLFFPKFQRQWYWIGLNLSRWFILQVHRAYAGHKKYIMPKRQMLPFFLCESLLKQSLTRLSWNCIEIWLGSRNSGLTKPEGMS